MQPQTEKTVNKFSFSNGLNNWFARCGVSLAFTSYGSGELFMLGRGDGGNISVQFSRWPRPMGLFYNGENLLLSSESHVFFLSKNAGSHGPYDAKFVPRIAHLTGDLDAHEIAMDRHGNVMFAATSHSCVAYLDAEHSFRVAYKPDWVSALVPEDRCHLNGIGLRDGELRYVSMVSRSDCLNGWRANREHGGAIFDVQSGKTIEDDCSMPHSPRWHDNSLWFLDSGEGWIYNGKLAVAFCPGFLRGLAFHDNYAITTVSLPRDGTFKGLALQDEIERRHGEAWCAVLIINLDTGAIEEWCRIEGPTRELFDVAVLEGCKCPMAVSPFDPQLKSMVTFPREKQRPELKAVQA